MQLVLIFSLNCNTDFDFWEVPKTLFVVFRWFYFLFIISFFFKNYLCFCSAFLLHFLGWF